MHHRIYVQEIDFQKSTCLRSRRIYLAHGCGKSGDYSPTNISSNKTRTFTIMRPLFNHSNSSKSASQQEQETVQTATPHSSNVDVQRNALHANIPATSGIDWIHAPHPNVPPTGIVTQAPIYPYSDYTALHTDMFPLPNWMEYNTSSPYSSWNDLQNPSSHCGTGLGPHVPAGLLSLPTQQKLSYVCWQHGCKGRSFTTLSNYRRHCREKSSGYAKPQCPVCGQHFLREAARDAHLQLQRCKIVGIDPSGNPVLIAPDSDDASWPMWTKMMGSYMR